MSAATPRLLAASLREDEPNDTLPHLWRTRSEIPAESTLAMRIRSLKYNIFQSHDHKDRMFLFRIK